jgi:hypothetical protein
MLEDLHGVWTVQRREGSAAGCHLPILREVQQHKLGDGHDAHNDPREEMCLKGVAMAKKRAKADNEQRQANRLEKQADARPEQAPKKPSQNEKGGPGGSPVVSR